MLDFQGFSAQRWAGVSGFASMAMVFQTIRQNSPKATDYPPTIR
jgi:hypothetical protein